MAEDERRTHVEDSIENSGSSTATDKPYQCVRESIQTTKVRRHRYVSLLIRNSNNCDLVCHLWQRSIIRWVASFQGQGQGVCMCVHACVCMCVCIHADHLPSEESFLTCTHFTKL